MSQCYDRAIIIGLSMCKLRRFHGEPLSRLNLSVPMEVVEAIDRLDCPPLRQRTPASAFVRRAIREMLNRENRRRA